MPYRSGTTFRPVRGGRYVKDFLHFGSIKVGRITLLSGEELRSLRRARQDIPKSWFGIKEVTGFVLKR